MNKLSVSHTLYQEGSCKNFKLDPMNDYTSKYIADQEMNLEELPKLER